VASRDHISLQGADDQKELIMKSFVFTIAAASALAMPIAAFSQTDATATRAQVRAELQQLKQAGYDPAKGENPNYPADIQAAEARVSAANSTTGYGGTASVSSSSGSRATTHPASGDEMRQIYFGGQ
jgi:type II secretory pathway pseudopilin PulG